MKRAVIAELCRSIREDEGWEDANSDSMDRNFKHPAKGAYIGDGYVYIKPGYRVSVGPFELYALRRAMRDRAYSELAKALGVKG